MTTIDKQFEKAIELVKTLPSDGDDKPSQEEKLEFYALFKQATEGDVTSDRPGMMDFTGKYKWDAWKAKEGMKPEEAKTKYVELLKAKLSKSTDQEQAKKILSQLEAA
ncbi:diazepam-binding inhibitor (GABA receptor modulator, acyl-CoA-binding protein) [Puccinia sorghi]|uniref:Diazepam-binding inhibitor (GABA receptor modulator, acyl-CoA-binding protein) n=1 Tax=Puccinia sorghi TaxID=27349 RepID=A0A0L6UAS2_9BASI|nr:diazepam-binding inhibitor (GABA receptor modulator, acyl-CoA-binding protein) [Puccinia sorghi]